MGTNLTIQTNVVQSPPQQESGIYTYAHQQIGPFLVGLVIGIFLGYLSHRLASRRDAKNRLKNAKDPFGVFIHQQIVNIPDHKVIGFYESTKQSIRDAVDRLWHYLPAKDRISLDELWSKYDKEGWAELEKGHKDEFHKELHECVVAASDNPQIEVPRELQSEIIKRYLNDFYKFSQ